MKIAKLIVLASIGMMAASIYLSCTPQGARQHRPEASAEATAPVKKSTGVEHPRAAQPTTTTQAKQASASVPAGAATLMKAYPNFVTGYKDGKLLLADGTSMTYNDGKHKSYTELLDNADPDDMLSIPYDPGKWKPGYLDDPGRIRCDALLKKMYGGSASAVRSNLVTVDWFEQHVQFNKNNGAAQALRQVAAELAHYPELRPYLKSSGTFYWRAVRGAQRMSAHSYGIAFDIGVDKSDNWLWSNPGSSETRKGLTYHNKFPHQLVQIFEKHGFIWGGRWYHYDTMHFEYRPELLVGAK